jgi:hypothetical protein
MDPDPGVPKTYGSCGSGTTALLLRMTHLLTLGLGRVGLVQSFQGFLHASHLLLALAEFLNRYTNSLEP